MKKIFTLEEWENKLKMDGIDRLPLKDRIYGMLNYLPDDKHQLFFLYLAKRPKIYISIDLMKELGFDVYDRMMHSKPSLRTLLNDHPEFGFKISKRGPRDKERNNKNNVNILY
jgi:hypothetical protein